MLGGTRKRSSLVALAMAAGLIAWTGVAGAATTSRTQAAGRLTDLVPAAANATDGATARLDAVSYGGSSTFVLRLTGLDPQAAGTTLGAHIHTGTCVAGNGSAAGPHYNTTAGTPSPTTEVWLDFQVLPGGYGVAVATVPFVVTPGAAHALVVHAQPTQAGGLTPGAAGARMACLPVEFQP